MNKRLGVFFLVILFLSIFSIYKQDFTGEAIKEGYEKEKTKVLEIKDGDTLVTEKGIIRLLGINTPEKGMFISKEATNFLLTLNNQSIEILRDVEDKDMYGRLLRYIFYNDTMINLEIVERGFAIAYMYNNLTYEKDFLRAEKYARENSLGLWQKSEEKCSECILLSNLNAQEEFFIIENICDFECDLSSWIVKDSSSSHLIHLSKVNSKESQKITSKTKIWNNDKDSFFMLDSKGKIVIYYPYSN